MEVLFWIIGFAAVFYFAIKITNFLKKLKIEITTLIPKINTEITTPIPKKNDGRSETKNCSRCGGLFEASRGFPNYSTDWQKAEIDKARQYCLKCRR